jgi:methylmalonyl-CoA mutase N-terminal domain/subunit
VGDNRFTEGDRDATVDLGVPIPDVEERQLKRLATVRANRSDEAVAAALARVAADAASPDVNLVPAILGAVRAYATLGEVVEALASVFGHWTEDPAL